MTTFTHMWRHAFNPALQTHFGFSIDHQGLVAKSKSVSNIRLECPLFKEKSGGGGGSCRIRFSLASDSSYEG